MTQLKDVYPLYLNNKAVQPNTDLAVTDKFTGEIAFRTALATPDVIDEAIAARRETWRLKLLTKLLSAWRGLAVRGLPARQTLEREP